MVPVDIDSSKGAERQLSGTDSAAPRRSFTIVGLRGLARFPDREDEAPFVLHLRLENVPGLPQEVGDIERSERVRAGHDNSGAGREARQDLPSLQRRKGTFEAGEIEFAVWHEARAACSSGRFRGICLRRVNVVGHRSRPGGTEQEARVLGNHRPSSLSDRH